MTEIINKEKNKVVKPCTCFQSHSLGHNYQKWPTVAIHSTFDAYCLLDKIVEIIQRCFYTFADPLWPCIKVKVWGANLSTRRKTPTACPLICIT